MCKNMVHESFPQHETIACVVWNSNFQNAIFISKDLIGGWGPCLWLLQDLFFGFKSFFSEPWEPTSGWPQAVLTHCMRRPGGADSHWLPSTDCQSSDCKKRRERSDHSSQNHLTARLSPTTLNNMCGKVYDTELKCWNRRTHLRNIICCLSLSSDWIVVTGNYPT